ncbi:DUF6491 family protein [Dyella sp.]|jgi:hypothetical protein|uniref:DUF6491 family protein n=1 Tax=Dyella sp. TaxID=1869338 RepID=UPI002D783320|nr:DUF6491 family protein [Dyella sp.]HET6432211.1 DUF6491 family protein [Dyella sp.]
MKVLGSFLCLALISAHAIAADGPQARTPIKPIGDCIRIDQINEWHIVDARTATVRTGPKRYRVNLTHDCPRLLLGPPGLFFHPNEANQAISAGRICGEVGETVSSVQQPPCAIASVQMIDKGAFEQLSVQARRHGNAAELPPAQP